MNQDKKQANRVVLVTGAARRVGAAIAEACHQAGFRVAIHCHLSTTDAHALAARLNNIRHDSACVFPADLADPAIAPVLVAHVLDWAGRLDLLVNNASLFFRSDCDRAQPEDWRALFTVNVQTPFALSVAARAALAAQQGAIVNITDIHAERPLKGYSVYCQTKAALLMQTRSLAREFAPEVRVNAVAPGSVAWPEHGNVLSEELQQRIVASTPLKRHGTPEFIAEAVLAMAGNRFVTGQVLNVDGGRSVT
ncbi:pteridine reductase [Legionella sp. CNM-4043-24]|uniref:pteridine reductase n=1 Tax=Legionella sp. CNM-4043-24 TaxID=3421646 RepID=UPI00403A7D21